MSITDYQSGPYRRLYDALTKGKIDRRTFIHRASLLGASLATPVLLANTARAVASVLVPLVVPSTVNAASLTLRPKIWRPAPSPAFTGMSPTETSPRDSDPLQGQP